MPADSRMSVLLLAVLIGCGTEAPPSQSLAEPVVELVRLSPESGALVANTTVLEAELRYSVGDTLSHPGPYEAQVFFRGRSGDWFRPATPEERAANRPNRDTTHAASGSVTLRYPLASVLGERALALPLAIKFSLNDLSGPLADTVVQFRVAPGG